MALIPGALASFTNPRAGAVPTLISFQYNPTQVTRVFRAEAPGTTPGKAPAGGARSAVWPPPEEYSLTLEFDATDGLERGGPVTETFGISPRLAALEMLMQPVGTSLLGGLIGRRCAAIPAGKLPLTLFVWGPWRIAPVKLNSLTIRETAFDELLNPIHAAADLGFSVLAPDDPDQGDLLARAAARYYQGARESRAILSLEQIAELGR
jgi:hypothetical protein